MAAGALDVGLGEEDEADACPQESKTATNVNGITENISNALESLTRQIKS